MNPNYLEKTIDIIKTNLQPLADKIGQGAGWTYELFVRQVYVNALTGLLWEVVGIGLLVTAKKCFDKKLEDKYDDWDDYNKWFLIVPVLGIGLALTLLPLSNLIQALVNPNYRAIKLIIDLVKTQTVK